MNLMDVHIGKCRFVLPQVPEAGCIELFDGVNGIVYIDGSIAPDIVGGYLCASLKCTADGSLIGSHHFSRTVVWGDETSISNVVCNDNGTGSDSTDDYITFDLLVEPNYNSTPNYNIDIPQGGSGSITPNVGTFNVASSFVLHNGSAGGGDIDLEIYENPGSQLCIWDITITDPGSCSVACTLNITDVSVGNCYADGIVSRDTVSVTVEWSNEPVGELIEVVIGGYLQTIDPVSLSSPQTLQFLMPANGATGNITAQFETTTGMQRYGHLYRHRRLCLQYGRNFTGGGIIGCRRRSDGNIHLCRH